jgi:hypothetical protein
MPINAVLDCVVVVVLTMRCLVLCLVFMAMACVAISPNNSRLSGVWRNQLNSTMTIQATDTTWPMFTGSYQTAVGDATGVYQLVGLYNSAFSPETALAFSVAWNNKAGDIHSATGWSGQLMTDGRIYTTWTLTQQTTLENRWGATRVGQDVFTKV